MIYLLFLVLIWKPVYALVMYYHTNDTRYKSSFYDWFGKLWYLVSPSN